MNYKNYDTIDFIQDEYFVRWVKNPDNQSEKFWKMWLDKHPEKRNDLIDAKNMVLDMGYQYSPRLQEEDYLEMFEGVLERTRTETTKQKGKQVVLRGWAKLAAVLALLILSTIAIYQIYPSNTPQKAISVVVTKSSPIGQKTITWLDDGTKVHLNAGSSIKYPKTFSDSTREVVLEGEAYFEVAKNANKPFIVTAGDIQTTVLGTVFTVRAYPGESKIDVAVEEGKVRVENRDNAIRPFQHVVTRNQMTSFDIPSGTAAIREIVPEEVFAWTDGIIYFNKASINQVLSTLERWYGVTFVVNRKLNPDQDFTFRYKNKPLKEILEGLSFTYKFEFELNDKIVTIN